MEHAGITPELVARHAGPAPRYTSYPTAPHFHSGVDNRTYWSWLQTLPYDAALSLYIHIPYCDRLCWFCGCHTRQVKRYEPITDYLAALHTEIRCIADRLEGRGRVVALHLGGGSPSMLTPADARALGELLRQSIPFADDAEISVELDPSDMDAARFDAMSDLGITRVSLGVQDFNEKVQVAINRIQSFQQTCDVVEAMRARGVASVNLDVLYGLPHQTTDSIRVTIDQVLSLDPDRVAVFGYAHVPWMKKHQRMIDEAALPGIEERFEQAEAAAAQIVAAGYDSIGIDHFAKPTDRLAAAARCGRLHRNFQGYTCDTPDALLGFGASAIGQLPQGYVQNVVATGDYKRRIASAGAAIARGLAFTDDDLVRAYVIERLMCDFAVSRRALRARFAAAADVVLAEMQRTADIDEEGLVESDGDLLRVTARGRPFVRSIAAGFDGHLNRNGARYSAAVYPPATPEFCTNLRIGRGDAAARLRRPDRCEACTGGAIFRIGTTTRRKDVVAPVDRSLVKSLPFFQKMGNAELDDMLSRACCRRYPQGTTVFEQGGPATAFFVLLHGRLKVTQITADGQQVIVRMVNPGDLFGIAKALQREDYPATATAVAESIALSWPAEQWDQLLAIHPALAVNAMHTVAGRLQEAHARLREMATEEVERRVAHAVLRLVQQSGEKDENGIRIDFPVSRQDIAEMTGTTLHTVSRILSAWKSADLVDGGRQKLTVRDPHRLLLIADGLAQGHL